jgi:hypothetical protein
VAQVLCKPETLSYQKKKKKEREMKINNHKTNKQKPTGKPGMVEQACTPSTGEVEAGGSRPAWASWFRI